MISRSCDLDHSLASLRLQPSPYSSCNIARCMHTPGLAHLNRVRRDTRNLNLRRSRLHVGVNRLLLVRRDAVAAHHAAAAFVRHTAEALSKLAERKRVRRRNADRASEKVTERD